MRKTFRALCCLLLGLGSSLPAAAQYYNWGSSPSSIHWLKTKTRTGSVIYPDYFQGEATKIISLLDTIYPTINYGFTHRPIRRLPLILHTQNMEANGIVIWAPKRMEWEAIPNIKSYAQPWRKQLAVHEYRHAVQYGNLYQGVMKPLGWFIGQHSGLISSILIPIWFLEGDAVMAETQFATFGRGLQPSYTIEYRAYLLDGLPEGRRKFRVDKWFSGSYKDFIPDHYQLGYQIASWSREQYGDQMWDTITRYATRRPYTIATTFFGLKKYYKTNVIKMFRSTFADLQTYWESLPLEENTSTIIPTPVKSYTVYDTPMPLNDSTVLVFKKDMDKINGLYEVNTRTGCERRLTYTGMVSTPPTLKDGVVYWTEYRASMFWEQRVFSMINSYDLKTGKKRLIRGRKNALYATPTHSGNLASIDYDYRGFYSVNLGQGQKVELPDSLSVHGLAYDGRTGQLAMIGLSDAGMAFYSLDRDGRNFSQISSPNYSSVYNLRAGDGKLSYNSIQSGKDEVHLYDLETSQEYRLTTSRFGSFSPSAYREASEMFLTTYTKNGYMLASQPVDSTRLIPVAPHILPENIVNPPRRKWDVPNIDVIYPDTALDSTKKTRRFRKGLHLFNPHSWLPVSYNPFQIVDESKLDFNFGATVVSQDLLSSTTAYLSYGHSHDGSRIRAAMNYYGLAPKFEVEVEWNETKQLLYGWDDDIEADIPHLKSHVQLGGSAYLPMFLSSGHIIRSLTPRLEVLYLNAMIRNWDEQKYEKGLLRSVWSLTYTEQTRMATRDFLPRWGYALRVSGVGAPLRSDFGEIYAAWGRVFMPGIAKHHSLMLRGNFQYQKTDNYNFFFKELYPRGADYNRAASRYGSFSVDYQFPLIYPDWGISSIVYFNRIRMNLYFDYAHFRGIKSMYREVVPTYMVNSYGGELIFDMRVLRMPVNDTSVGIHVYKPNDRNGVVVGANLSFPL